MLLLSDKWWWILLECQHYNRLSHCINTWCLHTVFAYCLICKPVCVCVCLQNRSWILSMRRRRKCVHFPQLARRRWREKHFHWQVWVSTATKTLPIDYTRNVSKMRLSLFRLIDRILEWKTGERTWHAMYCWHQFAGARVSMSNLSLRKQCAVPYRIALHTVTWKLSVSICLREENAFWGIRLKQRSLLEQTFIQPTNQPIVRI